MKKQNSDIYPVLYSRTSSGSIQTWQIIVENDSFYTIEGIQGGKLTQSKPTICEAKNVGRANATTAQDQAHRLAKVRIKAKREAGYVESLDEVSTAKTKPVYFQPMLAHKWADCKDKVQFPVFCQPKLDGCLAAKTLVCTDIGILPISEVVDNNRASHIKSYDIATGKECFAKIIGRMRNGIDIKEKLTKWYRVTLANGKTIEVTGNHRFYLPRLKCWRRADELNINDVFLLEEKS
jgi:hypothetical protein